MELRCYEAKHRLDMEKLSLLEDLQVLPQRNYFSDTCSLTAKGWDWQFSAAARVSYFLSFFLGKQPNLPTAAGLWLQEYISREPALARPLAAHVLSCLASTKSKGEQTVGPCTVAVWMLHMNPSWLREKQDRFVLWSPGITRRCQKARGGEGPSKAS